MYEITLRGNNIKELDEPGLGKIVGLLFFIVLSPILNYLDKRGNPYANLTSPISSFEQYKRATPLN